MADRVVLSGTITMDSSPFLRSAQAARGEMKALNKQLNSQQKAYKQTGYDMEALADRSDMLYDSIAAQTKILQESEKQYHNVSSKIKDKNNMTDKEIKALQYARSEVVKHTNTLRGLGSELDKVRAMETKLKMSTDALRQSQKDLEMQNARTVSSLRQNGDEVGALQAHYSGLQKEIKENEVILNKEQSTLKELSKTMSESSQEYIKQSKIVDVTRQKHISLINTQDKVSTSLKKLTGDTEENVRHTGRMGAAFAGISRLAGTMSQAFQNTSNTINRMGNSFRNVGYVIFGMALGTIISNMSTLIPMGGSLISVLAGIGGMAASAGGGVIGLYGAFGIAGLAAKTFAGQATTALQMVEDGEMGASAALTNYKNSLSGLQNQWKALVQSNSGDIFGTMTNGINIARYALTTLNPFIVKTTNQIYRFSGEMRKWVTSSKNAAAVFNMLNSIGPKVFGNILKAVLKVTDGVASLVVSFSPLFTWVSSQLVLLSNRFNTWANSVGTKNGITDFINYTKVMLPITGQIFQNVFLGIIGVIQAFAGHSIDVSRGILGVTESFKKWGQSLKNTEGFKNFINYLNANGPKVWQLLKNIGVLLVNMIQGLAPVGAVMLSVAVGITSLLAKFSGLNKLFAGLIGIISVVIGSFMAFGPAIVLIKDLLPVVTGAFGLLKGAAVAVGTALAGISLPVWGVIAAIVALGAGFVIAYKKSETFRNIVNGALQGVVNGFKAAWNGIRSIGSAIGGFIMNNIIQPIATFGAQIIGQVQSFWAANGPLIMQALRNIWSLAQPILMGIFNLFKTVFMGALNVVVSILRTMGMVIAPILAAVGQIFIAAFNYMMVTFRNIWNVIKGVVSGALTVILGIIKVFAGLFTGNWRAVWSGLKMIVQGAITVVVSIFRGMWTQIVNIVGFFGSIVKAVWFGLWGALKGIVLGIIGVIATSVRAVFNGIVTFLGFIWTNIKVAASVGWNIIKNVIMVPVRAIGSTIRSIFNGVKNFLVWIWGIIKNTVVARARSLWAGIRVIWTILSNVTRAIFNGLRTFFVWIWNIIRNFVVARVRSMWNGIRVIWTILSNVTRSIFNGLKTFFVWIWNVIKNSVVARARSLWAIVRGVWNVLSSVSRSIFNGVRNFIVAVWNNLKNRTIATSRILWNVIRGIWNTLVRVSRGLFSSVRNFIVAVWNNLKNRTVATSRVLWNIIRGVWNTLSRVSRSIFSSVRNFLVSVWNNLKNRTVATTRVLWNIVRGVWNTLSRVTRNIFNGVRNFLVGLWTKIRDKVAGFASSLWNKVRGTWNNLSGGTKSIFNKVRNYLVDKWEGIKDKVTGIVSSLWGKVKDTFTNMKDGIKGLAGKIGDTITGMVDGIKKGLNALIKGVNWVAEKLGVDKKIPKLSTGTGGASYAGSGVGAGVSNGAVSSPGLAVVNDRGRGNGSGAGGHQEVIQKANGQMIAPKGRDVTVPLEKGDIVHSGRSVQKAQRAGVLPRFASGTGRRNSLLKNARKHKEDEELYGDVIGDFNLSGGGVKDWLEDRGEDVKRGAVTGAKVVGKKGKQVKDGAVAAGKKVAKMADDLLDYVGNPGKLLDATLSKFGVKFPKINGEIPRDMMWNPMWKTLKNATKSLFDGWLEDADGGDGGYIDLSKGINFPYSPNGRAPGYPFAGPHMGIDVNYIYDKLYSVLSGKATARKGWNGGFGNMVDIVKGNLKVIYGHMSKHAFSGSKQVKPGDYLGVSGNSGRSSGPHLHFEVQKNGKPIDPIKWLKDNNGGGGSGKWKGTVKKALKIAGLPTGDKYVNAWLKQIQTESGGNAKAHGGTDGLADGRAKGLVQVKPGTFNAYKMKGYGNIWKGLDNLIAGMRYANARYGNAGLGVIGKGHGYASGTNAARAGLANVFEKGGEIMNLRGGEQIIPNDVSINALKSMMSSDLFARTQSAVYAGISQYADALRQQEAQNRKEQMRLQKQNSESSNDREMLNALMQMVAGQQEEISLLRQLVASSQNIESQPKGFTERDVSTAQGNRTRMSRFNKGI